MTDRGAMPARHRSGFALAILVALACALLAGLGSWQLDRLQWKKALIAERRAAIDAPAVVLARPQDAEGLAEYRHVQVRGTFRHDRELAVGPRTHDGTAGWRIVTPLELAAGGFVLIDRGFVPDALKQPPTRPQSQPAGPVTIDGLLRRPGEPGPFQPANVPEKAVWFRVEPAAMAEALGLSAVAPFWVAAGASGDSGAWPRGGVEAVMPANNHLQYAITWYALAIALLAVYAAFRRREKREARD